jgi:pyruvate kinase
MTNKPQAAQRRKTKIVSTLGPASSSPEVIRDLIKAGVNVFRLNFSHGSHEDHGKLLNTVRTVAKELDAPIAVLQDLSGPKIRITEIAGGSVNLEDGAPLKLRSTTDKTLMSDANCIQVMGLDPSQFVKPGEQVLLSDGYIDLRVESVSGAEVSCKIIRGGNLRSKQGIAFPGSMINLPATTEKDLHDLKWGLENGVDYVAISFVQTPEDVKRVRDFAASQDKEVRIISKIEMKTALKHIDEILELSDGVMVARGDLGVELPVERVPLVQKELIEKANYLGIPVIVATQMMASMVKSIRPTRAEVTDVATAVMAGADAVMLSEETAIGDFPVIAVQYLDRIAREAETTFTFAEYKLRMRDSDKATVPDAIAYAACAASVKVNAGAIICCTETGYSARLVAKYRPQQPLYGLSSRPETVRRMALYWGVCPMDLPRPKNHANEVEIALSKVQLREKMPNGSIAVVTGGLSVATPGATSQLDIRAMNYRHHE